MSSKQLLLLINLLSLTSAQQRPSVALIIGGQRMCGETCHEPTVPPGQCGSNPSIIQHSSVELFGCPDGIAPRIPDLPTTLSYASGTTVEWDGLGSVMVCGGWDCIEYDEEYNNVMSACYIWNAANNAWTRTDDLQYPRSHHVMWTGPVLNQTVVGGHNPFTEAEVVDRIEIFTGVSWVDYLTLPLEGDGYPSVSGDGCMTMIGSKVYMVGDSSIEEFDLWTGENRVIDVAVQWDGCYDSCSCAPLELDGSMGIYLSVGNWIDLETLTWRQLTPAGIDEFIGNLKLVDFRGTATVFGNNTCDAEGYCFNSGSDVIAYDARSDSWVKIGEMQEARSYHTVVEIPGEVCDFFVVKNEN